MKNNELISQLKLESEIHEAYFTALCWHEPDNYSLYSGEKINSGQFLNQRWSFFYGLGKYMFDQGIKTFDDISVYKAVKEAGKLRRFNELGGFAAVDEVVREVKDYPENIESYYNHVKKSFVLKELWELLGDKVLETRGNYDYKKLTQEQIVTYWNDKLNTISMNIDNTFDTHNLFDNMDDFIKTVEEGSQKGMPFYQSKHLTRMINGWPKGHITMYGGFGNAGKTSVVFNKVVMSCIVNREKLVVIANEESINAFTEKLFVTVLGAELKQGIDRRKFIRGGFTNEDKQKIEKAKEWVKEITEGKNSLIKFVFMEEYIMDDVEKVIRHHHNRGYESFIIDTHKVSERSSYDQRWVTFVEDTKKLYQLTREDGGGLNLRMWLNFQLADHAVNRKYLDFGAIGEGKAAKNEASVVLMMRALWDSEYENIEVWRHEKVGGEFVKNPVVIDRDKTYFLLFTSKNRFGANNDGGQPVLVMQPNFNFNTWDEIGFTYIAQDRDR